MDWRRSCALTVMQVEDPSQGVYMMPVAWFFADKDAQTYYGPNAFTSGIWDHDEIALPPDLGEQPPYEAPWYNGKNVWGYKGQCVIGTPAQFAGGLKAADLSGPPPPRPTCCIAAPVQLGLGARVNLGLWKPAVQFQTSTPGVGTWTAPAGVSRIVVEVWGAGAVGASGAVGSFGTGGGGGAYAKQLATVVPAGVYPYFVGDGTLGAPKSNGQTWFKPGTLILADCGGHSTLIDNPLPGLASACFGDLAITGGYGSTGPPGAAGGGGSSAGTGQKGSPTSSAVQQAGGISPSGGGDGGRGADATDPPGYGVVPGGGGGGQQAIGPVLLNGGNGLLKISY